MLKQSLYDLAEHRLDEVKHLGYTYAGKVLQNSLSSYIYRDDTRAGMIDSMEPVVTEMIDAVKRIKNFVHYAVSKNYRNRN